MRWLYLVVVTGCATAAKDSPNVGGRPDGGGGSNKPDASTLPPPDAAPLPDAPARQMQVTLSQTNNMTPAAGAGQACGHSIASIPVGTADNSWYPVFKLSDYGITGAFNVQRVTFYSDYAYGGTGTSQTASIKLGTYSGTLDADRLSTGAMTNISTKAI